MGLIMPTQPVTLSHLVFTLRNPETDRSEFRKTLRKIGECLALEILAQLGRTQVSIKTLTGGSACHELANETPALVTILRAGLPLNDGIMKVFPDADVGFLGMARDEETLKAKTTYAALPSLKDRCVILSDTMLATGGSIIDAIEILHELRPKKIFVVAAIASQVGIDRVLKKFPEVSILTAAIDPELNEKGYIIPGLGDAGDRSFGEKAQLPSLKPERKKADYPFLRNPFNPPYETSLWERHPAK